MKKNITKKIIIIFFIGVSSILAQETTLADTLGQNNNEFSAFPKGMIFRKNKWFVANVGMWTQFFKIKNEKEFYEKISNIEGYAVSDSLSLYTKNNFTTITWNDLEINKENPLNKYKGNLPNGNWVLKSNIELVKGVFVNGRPEGEWKYYDRLNGKLLNIEIYKNGKPDGLWIDFNRKTQFSFKNGFAHGTWGENNSYNYMGESQKLNYINGKLNGVQYYEHKNKGISFKCNFKNHIINGDFIQYNNIYPNEILIKTSFKDGNLNDSITIFSKLNPKEIKLKGYFVNGIPSGEWNFYSISKYDESEGTDCKFYYLKQDRLTSNNSIIKKIIFSDKKISEYELFDNNNELKLVSERYLDYKKLFEPKKEKFEKFFEYPERDLVEILSFIRETLRLSEVREIIDESYAMKHSERIESSTSESESNDYSDKNKTYNTHLEEKKIKYYKNGKIQYIGYYPEDYAKVNSPQYFSPEGNLLNIYSFKNSNWYYKDDNTEANESIFLDDRYGYYRILTSWGSLEKVEIPIF
jgi:antitoxin component YwqK of YwqJK toxin-antitoxin module